MSAIDGFGSFTDGMGRQVPVPNFDNFYKGSTELVEVMG